MKLKINGKERDLVFGSTVFQMLCDELGISYQDIDLAVITNDKDMLNNMVYAGLRNGAACNNEQLDFNFHQFIVWLDNEPQQTADDIMSHFLASKMMGVTMKDRYNEMVAIISKNQLAG